MSAVERDGTCASYWRSSPIPAGSICRSACSRSRVRHALVFGGASRYPTVATPRQSVLRCRAVCPCRRAPGDIAGAPARDAPRAHARWTDGVLRLPSAMAAVGIEANFEEGVECRLGAYRHIVDDYRGALRALSCFVVPKFSSAAISKRVSGGRSAHLSKTVAIDDGRRKCPPEVVDSQVHPQ